MVRGILVDSSLGSASAPTRAARATCLGAIGFAVGWAVGWAVAAGVGNAMTARTATTRRTSRVRCCGRLGCASLIGASQAVGKRRMVLVEEVDGWRGYEVLRLVGGPRSGEG